MNIKTTFLQKILLVCLGLLILVIVEIGLRLTGWSERSSRTDPFVGFEKVYPLFGENTEPDGGAVFSTNPNKLSFFNYQQFEKTKPANTFRVFCFGGSTTYGRPYQAETAFPNWLETNLNLLDRNRRYEVINCGGISYASYRIVHLVEEAVRYSPDLFVLYCGHNEFLESRTYEGILTQNAAIKKIQVLLDKLHLYVLLRNSILKTKQKIFKSGKSNEVLENEVAAILDANAGLESYDRENLQKKSTVEHYRYNLEKIVRIAKEHNIKIVLATVTSNVKDFSPFKSQHKADITQQELATWNEHYQKGQVFQKQQQYKNSLIAYQECFTIDDLYAELIYNIAQCLYQTKQYDLAKKYYYTAKELDICPLRATAKINSTIKNISAHLDVPVVNIEAEFEKLGPHKIADSSYLIDHVHPTIKGNQIIAEKIAHVFQQEGIIPAEKIIDRTSLTAAYQKILTKLSDEYYASGTLNLAKVLGWAGKEKEKFSLLARSSKKLQGYFEYHYMMGNSSMRNGELDKAIMYFRNSISLNPNFSESYTNLGFALERNGSPDEALKNYEKALSLKPADYIAQTNIGRIYYIKGDHEKAKSEYKKAIQMKSDYAHAHEGLGVIYHKQGNTKQALTELNRAIELDPNYAEAYYDIGLIYLDQRKTDLAITYFKKAIKGDPFYSDAYSSLGVSYYQKKMLDKTIEQLNMAITIKPESARAHNNLAVAYHSAGKFDLAWRHVKAAQRLNFTVHPKFIEMLKNDSKKIP